MKIETKRVLVRSGIFAVVNGCELVVWASMTNGPWYANAAFVVLAFLVATSYANYVIPD